MELKIKSKIYGDVKYLIDDEDYEKIKSYNWFLSKSQTRLYIRTNIYNKKVYLHRFITKALNLEIVDHINNNTLDNRKQNLRICNNQENSMNSKKTKKISSSKYKGVCYDKKRKKFESQITKNYKKIHLGYYESEIDAALIYNGAAKYLFREYANLNTI